MKRLGNWNFLPVLAIILITGASGCRRHPEPHTDLPVAARMDDSVLTVAAVEALLPSGLSSHDSLELAHSIIEDWIEDRLYEAYLSSDPNEDMRIQRMVDDYRRKLRMESYRRRMRRLHEPPVNADSVRAYYIEHRKDLITEHPLVKGLFLKVPENSPILSNLRQWSIAASADDIRRIEEEAGVNEFESEYFGDTWVEFDILASEIPYRFGNADSFLEKTKNFETAADGYCYLLHIYDYLPSGSEMPYEFAEIQIRDILQESRLEAYRRGLLKALRERARREKRLKIQ